MSAQWYCARSVDTIAPAPGSGSPPYAVVTAGVPLDQAAVVIIALHGRDQVPTYLVENLVLPLGNNVAVAWLLPHAREQSWYPDRADTNSPANDAAIAGAIERLRTLRERVSATTAPVMMLGFSQGACLACAFAAHHPDLIDALVALTGGLTGADPDCFHVTPFPGPTPAYFATGDQDPWIDVARVKATAAAFAAAGATTAVHIAADDGDHHIRTSEVALVADLVKQLAEAHT